MNRWIIPMSMAIFVAVIVAAGLGITAAVPLPDSRSSAWA